MLEARTLYIESIFEEYKVKVDLCYDGFNKIVLVVSKPF